MHIYSDLLACRCMRNHPFSPAAHSAPSFPQIERVYRADKGAKVLEAFPNEYFLDQVRLLLAAVGF